MSPNEVRNLVANAEVNTFLPFTIVKKNDFNEDVHLSPKKVCKSSFHSRAKITLVDIHTLVSKSLHTADF